MRRRVVLVLSNLVLLLVLAAPAGASGGICIPSNDPHHKPPLCVT